MLKRSDDLDPLMKELKPLLKSIQKGITSFGIKKFTLKLDGIFLSENDLDHVAKIVIKTTCEDFEIPTRNVFGQYAIGKNKEAKHICACILHLEYGVPIRVIGRYIFKNKQFGFVATALKKHRHPDSSINYKAKYHTILSKVKDQLK